MSNLNPHDTIEIVINENSQLMNLVKNLREDEEIVIRKSGQIRIKWRNSRGETKSKKAGNLFTNNESKGFGIKSKPWAAGINPSLKKWSNFGNTLPKRDNTEIETKLLMGIFFQDFNGGPKYWGKFTEPQTGFSYEVKINNGIKGFYFQNTLRWLEKENEPNKKYLISQHLPSNISTK